jgi:hypothetical protein
MQPQWYQILLASAAVMLGCAGSAYGFWYAVRHRNPLLYIPGAGAALVGLVGERTPVAATGRPASVWDLTVQIPALPLKLDEVTLAGLIVLLVGISLVLFLEGVTAPERRWKPPPPRGLDEDDSV